MERLRETLGTMPLYKRLVMTLVGLLVIIGIFDAVHNLPVVSGCGFYGRCSQPAQADPPSELGRSPAE